LRYSSIWEDQRVDVKSYISVYNIAFVLRRVIYAAILVCFPLLKGETIFFEILAVVCVNYVFNMYVFRDPPSFTSKVINNMEKFNEFCYFQMSILFMALSIYQQQSESINQTGNAINWFLISMMSINIIVVIYHLCLDTYKHFVLERKRKVVQNILQKDIKF